MSLIKGLVNGIVCSLTMSSPPLYRYPYRNTLEAFRSDWKRIGGDIDAAMRSMNGQGQSEGEKNE